jgi:hypothetical protein
LPACDQKFVRRRRAVAGKRRKATTKAKVPADVRRDQAGGPATGGHLGHAVDRGLLGGSGERRARVGHGRTSFRAEDPSSGGALGPEGTDADLNRPMADQIRDGEDRHSRHPQTLGLGAGDPGYTAEEDDQRPSVAEQQPATVPEPARRGTQ